VCGVFRPAETGFDHCETCLHEDHKGCTNNDPEKVEAKAVYPSWYCRSWIKYRGILRKGRPWYEKNSKQK
jgi:hypothetical protein